MDGLVKRIGLASLLVGLLGASNQHLADEPQWHPKVPLRADSVETYCAIWANKVVYGVSAWLRASADERSRRLVISYQTGQQDRDDPEVKHSIDSDDGSHAQIQVVTDGHDESGHWFLDEDVVRWAEDVFFFGWQWAGAHPLSEAQIHAGMADWLHAMHAVCMADNKL